MNSSCCANVAIVGAGTQGAQIAFRCLISGRQTNLFDISEKKVGLAQEKIATWLLEHNNTAKRKSRPPIEILENLSCMNDLGDCVSNVDLIIEAVPEILELKQSVWQQIDLLAPRHTLLASNSSSLPSSLIGKDVARKDKTFSVNFGQPAQQNHVEVMWNEQTSPKTKEYALSFLRSMGFIPLVTKKEIMGFSLNRTWRAIKKEVLHLVDQNYVDFQDIDRGFFLEFGMEMGPFQLMDMIGLDVIRDIELCYFNESGDPSDKPPQILEDLVAKGHLGVKSGRGFYRYPNPAFSQIGWLEKKND